MKSLLTFSGFGMALFVAFGLTITTSEPVPPRARFLVNKQRKFIVPEPLPGQFIFYPLPGTGNTDFAKFEGTVSWAEFSSGDGYKGYDLPRTKEWERFVLYGNEVSLLRSWVFPPPSRWDEQGRWRY